MRPPTLEEWREYARQAFFATTDLERQMALSVLRKFGEDAETERRRTARLRVVGACKCSECGAVLHDAGERIGRHLYDCTEREFTEMSICSRCGNRDCACIDEVNQ